MRILVLARAPAVIERILPLLRAAGMEAAGTTSDDDAVTRVEQEDFAALVIGGGVEEGSRHRLRVAGRKKGVRVIDGALRGRDPETYVRDELLPALAALGKAQPG